MTYHREGPDIRGAGTFLYDRDCGFCQRAVAFGRDRVRTRTAFVAWQEFDLAAVGLTPEQADREAWIVYPDGRHFAGGDAVAEALVHGRFLARPLGRLLRLPLVRALNRAAYRWVAANRYRLPGGTAACSIDEG
ncbi:DCC1-like thiol-disulfide oxidoreductase family protein [Nocardiopsis sp. NPDC049922]|uniref:thiol-disulfide oxidoreductase DCC family protein n=1 Tax=Nocardiopsis sp. NPDC049922 TaxID=3155157 RepID=UPI0033C2ACFB